MLGDDRHGATPKHGRRAPSVVDMPGQTPLIQGGKGLKKAELVPFPLWRREDSADPVREGRD
jgi:hypothetical protein